MHPVFATAGKNQAIPIWFVNAANFDEVRKKLGSSERAFISTAAFEAKAGRSLLLPDGNGKLAGVLFGIEGPDDPDHDRFRPGQLVGLLPAGTYRFANRPHDTRLAALAFALGSYQFSRYRKSEARNVRVVLPEGVDGDMLSHVVEGVTLCRDLTNIPSNDMGPLNWRPQPERSQRSTPPKFK